jgi:Flp pilus assembly pilin Flp
LLEKWGDRRRRITRTGDIREKTQLPTGPAERQVQPMKSLRHSRGAAMTEYTVLIGLVALVSMAAFIGLGVALATSFESRRELILYPFP